MLSQKIVTIQQANINGTFRRIITSAVVEKCPALLNRSSADRSKHLLAETKLEKLYIYDICVYLRQFVALRYTT